MLFPTIFNSHFTDDFFDDVFAPVRGNNQCSSLMKTDVKEQGDNYQMEIELPGYGKDDVTAELKDGYLTISASKNEEKEDKDSDGRYVRRERRYGSCQRTFYVGKKLEQEDFKASFENGILKLEFPKEDAKEAVEEKKFIAIG